MKILVINLLDRIDRLQTISSHLQSKGIEFQVVKAVDKHDIPTRKSIFLTSDVERIFQSHLRCMEIAAKNVNDFSLILEDDSLLNIDATELKLIVEAVEKSNIDFLQIGFLRLNIFDGFEIFLRNFNDYLIRMRIFSSFLSLFGFKESKRANSQPWRKSLERKFVLNDIRYGAHSYIVSSDFAKSILLLNEPNFLAIDDLFVSIGRMKSFRMARLRRSRSAQSLSKSSVMSRYNL